MARYEMVREIQNECERNQMRDVFFQEIETDDPVETVRQMLRHDRTLEISVEVQDEDDLVVYANCSGMVQKFVFTRI